MKFYVKADVLVFTRKGKQVFTFPYEHEWEVPERQLKVRHHLGHADVAKMIFELSAKRRIEEQVLENKEYRYAIERDMPWIETEPVANHNGYYAVRFDNQIVQQID